VVPYFLFTGRHLTEDIPETLANLRRLHPKIQFSVTDNLGLEDYFIELVSRRITDYCPALLPYQPSELDSPGVIEKKSLEIVERILPPELSGEEREVTRRLVHASGDPFIARLVKFSPGAVSSGTAAIHKACPIYTDVRMVYSGINRRTAESFGCSLNCALDEAAIEKGEEKGRTRSAAAMLALIEMLDSGLVRPALVIGMPVGFVQAKESKTELMKRQVPFISLEGTRGGSPLAAAAVNAILRLARG
jgi:precorrin-8X/cobalt-precorrin-8 methylmutase